MPLPSIATQPEAPQSPAWRTTIIAAFDRTVARRRHAPAVECAGTTRTYAELSAAGCRFAARLAAAGVRRGDVVGVCVGRSPEFLATLLAILRCGAAYAPLPTEYPLRRLVGMVDDAGVRVIVTDTAAGTPVAGLRRARPGIVEVPVAIDELWQGGPVTPPDGPGITPEDPAYVMFTSGSTGRPRGVVVPHRAVAGLVLGQSYADFGPGLRTLLLAPPAFDASTFEIWAPLLHGGTVVVYPDADVVLARLATVLGAGRVNCLWLTSGLFNLVVDLVPSAFAGVAHVLTGGDVLSVPHVRRAFAAVPGIRITNGYGPTETTTFACTHAIDPSDPAPDGAIPIGVPLAHTECLVVDDDGRPVADGTAGELWIGGSGVALRALAAEPTGFITDPWGAGTGRWYRSGDRCRRLPDGRFVFVGRRDRQVKIRGHRVEPAELELALGGHPQVQATAAVPIGVAEDVTLGAVVTRRDGRTTPIAGLRDWLAARVPAALVPTRIVVATALPLTPNGKVDRDAVRALVAPAAGPERMAAADDPGPPAVNAPTPDVAGDLPADAPRGPLESLLANLWRELLEIRQVRRDDDFFMRGGSSLLAMRLVARIARATGTRLPVRTVFDRPRLAELAAAIGAAGGTPPAPDRPGPAAPAVADELPVLPAQRAIWVLRELLPDPATYNQPFAFRANAAIDPAELRDALAALLRRHPALRAGLTPSPAGPILRVSPAEEVDLEWTVEEDIGPETIAAALVEHARRPFDLARPPLWRATYFPHAADHGVILFVFHHAIIDDWSVALFLDDLATLSSGGHAALPASPPPPGPAPSPARRAVLEMFWRSELAAAPTPLRLPGAGPVAAAGTRGAVLHRRRPGLAGGVHEAARAAGCTLAQWLVTVVHAWLRRITAADDIVLLTPFSLRNAGVAEDVFGCHLNTLPIRVRWRDAADDERPTADTTLVELAARVRATMIAAGDHVELPLDGIFATTASSDPRGDGPADILVVVTAGMRRAGRFGAAVLEPLPCDTATAKFGATVFIDIENDDVDLAVEYATAVYDTDVIAAHLATLATFLEGAVRTPAASIESLPLGGPAPDTVPAPAPPAAVLPVHAAALGFARTAPDLPAVIDGTATLTYAELDDRSRALAARLTTLGSVAEERVGICLPRGAASCVGLLAVLRAGGACVPLDAALPPERLARMAAIAGVRFVVCDDATAPIVAVLAGVVAGVVAVPVAGHPAPPTFVEPAVPVTALAYVLFTSGSTGDPKGVEMPHGPLAALCDWQTRSTPRSPGDRTLHFAAIGFDVAFQEVLATWAAGCAVVVADDDVRRDPARLVDLIIRARVDRIILPTAMLVPFAEAVLTGAAVPALLRDVIVSGERLHVTDEVRRLFTALVGCRLWNQYGPTETHVVTAHRLEGPPSAWPDHPPIGLPIDGALVAIIGPGGVRLPPGCIGEIVLGGGCLARGYASRPDLTAERFPTDAGPAGPRRTYRTGDVGWRRPDGAIECLGRNDRQVKISGHRIEPAEIEAALVACPGVRRAAVIVRRSGGPTAAVRLAAFLEVGPDWPGHAATRARLRTRLAAPMIPAALTTVDRLPVTVNGKIDRRALAVAPIDEDASAGAGTEGTAPEGPIETAVAEVWSHLLGARRVSREDDFFALGGRSLTAMLLVAALERRLGVRLAVRTVFDRPRLADLAAAIDAIGGSGSAADRIAAAAPDGVNDIPALPLQRGLWVLEHLLPDPAASNQPLAIRPRGPVEWGVVRGRLLAIMARHPALRTALVETEDGLVQRIAPPGDLGLPWEVDEETGPDRLAATLVRRARAPFDLGQAPLWRATLFPAAAPHGVLLFVFHHAIIDDWSLNLLLRELASDTPPESMPVVPVLPSASDPVAARGHWRTMLDGAPAAVAWPGERPTPTRPTGRGGLVRFTIPPEIVAAWERIARARATTLFHAWLGACHVWLQDATGSRDTVVLTPLANRAGDGIVDAVGCFLNMVPVRLRDPAVGATAADVAGLMRTVVVDAFDCGRLPFDEIVASVPGAAGSRLQPVANVAFVFLERDAFTPRLAGTAADEVAVHTGTARFDLTLSLVVPRTGGPAAGMVEFSCDALDEATVHTLVARFSDLLARVAAQPDLAVVGRAPARAAAPGGTPATARPPADAPAPRPSGAPPQGATEATIARVWSEALGGVVVSRDDRFFDIGGHSLMGIRVVHALERAFGVRIPVGSLFAAPRLADLAALIDRAAGERAAAGGDGGVIVPLQPLGHAPAMFFCHGYGGGVSGYLPLAAALGPDIPVFGILARDFAAADPQPASMPDLVECYVDEILRVVPDGTVHLGGHSVAGWYAYEIARCLRRRGARVGMLALLDTAPAARVPWSAVAARIIPRTIDLALLGLHALRRTTLSHRIRSMRRGGRAAVAEEPQATAEPTSWMDRHVVRVRACRSGPYDGVIDFFRATDCRRDAVPLWRGLARGGVRVHPVPADHQSMLRHCCPEIAAVMRRTILGPDAGPTGGGP